MPPKRLMPLAGLLAPALALAQSPAALSIFGPGGQITFRADDLKALHHESVAITNGHTHARETYSGVPLFEILSKAGAPAPDAIKGKALSEYIVATGADAYKAVVSLAEAEPGFHPGTVLVADTLDGKPLDAKEGPFKLVVSEDERPARSVHNLVKVELKQAE